jgi:hypothetical protein
VLVGCRPGAGGAPVSAGSAASGALLIGSGGRARTCNNRLQRPAFYQLNYPRSGCRSGYCGYLIAGSQPPTATLVRLMGSLIKKRRKRMRKKKHKKMLKRTRWQRRAAGK